MVNWTDRSDPPRRRPGDPATGKPRKATLAAAALLIAQLVMQVLNFLRADLAPIKEALASITRAVARVEQRLEDHERRLKRLEDGESQLDKPQRREPRAEAAER